MVLVYFGMMGSGKSHFLMAAHYGAWGKKAAALPALCAERLDFKITSRRRSGFLPAVEVLKIPADAKSVFVDEGQFLTDAELDFLLELHENGAKVKVFALERDFADSPFPISARLAELPRATLPPPRCQMCGEKAEINARIDATNGRIVKTGEQFALKNIVRYAPLCRQCWNAPNPFYLTAIRRKET